MMVKMSENDGERIETTVKTIMKQAKHPQTWCEMKRVNVKMVICLF